MQIVFSENQRLHNPTHEMHRGELVPCFETTERVDLILKEIQKASFGPIISPPTVDRHLLESVHSPDYLNFIEQAHSRWELDDKSNKSLFPHVWRASDMSNVAPTDLFGGLGYYSFDVSTPITENTWAAALGSASSAAHGADLLAAGANSAFSLCRPPGHHAAASYYGGYCFINNAAIAAERLVESTGKSVALLDVDYHHGNGTQSIFYNRSDVLFASIHADPLIAYPYFLGHANECGEGDGRGFNINVPLPFGTSWSEYETALESVLSQIDEFNPGYLVVSLGVDTFENDPISRFKLATSDFSEMGSMLRSLNRPTLFVMEGGYAIDQIGHNVVATLDGFKRAD